MTLTHVFFEVPRVLVDPARLAACYADNLGRLMAQRYGLTPGAWVEANRRILADWDSYYADLNLNGDDGMDDLREGLFRTTRALFRLTGMPEPPKDELIALSRELPVLAASGCDALYDDVPPALADLDAGGLVLGVISHALSDAIRAVLAPVVHHFKGTIWGADRAERFDKDVQRFQFAASAAHVAPQACLVVDDRLEPLLNARRIGMRTAQVRRSPPLEPSVADYSVVDLRELVELCLRR